jgi:hypothetical protein
MDHELVRGDGVVEAAAQATDRALELGVLEGGHSPAPVADDMMVMLAARHDRLVAIAAVSEIDALGETEVVEEIERPVDARDPDRTSAPLDPLSDLLRREAAVLARKQLDHGAPRPAGAMSGLLESVTRSVRPLLGLRRHFRKR